MDVPTAEHRAIGYAATGVISINNNKTSVPKKYKIQTMWVRGVIKQRRFESECHGTTSSDG